MIPMFMYCVGDTLASMINMENIIRYPLSALPDGAIPLVGPVSTKLGSGRIRRDGQIDANLHLSAFPSAYFDPLIMGVFGSWTVSSVDKYIIALDESRRWSSFLVTINRPAPPAPSGTGDYTNGAGGSIKDLRLPLTNCQIQLTYKSANATLTASERTVMVNTASGDKTMTLPPVADVQAYTPVSAEKTAAAHTLTVTDGGSLSVSTTVLGQRLYFIHDGTTWARWRG